MEPLKANTHIYVLTTMLKSIFLLLLLPCVDGDADLYVDKCVYDTHHNHIK